MIHIYTGDGKGKTTAGLGLLLRAFGAGFTVSAVFFDKGGDTPYHERKVFERLGIPYTVCGMGRMNSDGTFRFSITDADRAEAQRGLVAARSALQSGVGLLLLDEVLTSTMTGLIAKADVQALVESVPASTELVMTGRCQDDEILAWADLVSRVTKVRHYFDRGVKARPGIEF